MMATVFKVNKDLFDFLLKKKPYRYITNKSQLSPQIF